MQHPRGRLRCKTYLNHEYWYTSRKGRDVATGDVLAVLEDFHGRDAEGPDVRGLQSKKTLKDQMSEARKASRH